MPSDIKIPFALRKGNLIHISEVSSGRQNDCLCPVCEQPLIARKPKVRRQHFAHDPGSNCNPETVLHWLGKTLIFSGIQRALDGEERVCIKWSCDLCGEAHTGNLIRNTKAVRLEQNLDLARPDVLLLDGSNTPLVAIEIIVSHPPEDEVKHFYNSHGIALIEVKLKTVEDIEALRDLREFSVTSFTHCPQRKCRQCNNPCYAKHLHVVTAKCYECKRSMKVSFFLVDGGHYAPSEFSDIDISVARMQGCRLENRWSNTAREEYLANICGNCDAFIGEFFLHEYWDLASETTGLPTGYFCPECEMDSEL